MIKKNQQTKKNQQMPDPRIIERELGDFLAKKFGGRVKIVSPADVPQELLPDESDNKPVPRKKKFEFDLKPEELVAHLDQYIVKQDQAKAILSTKICTHYNRIKQAHKDENYALELVGGIKNNVLMIGPTGVGKTYLIKLIAKKIGVPFVKGDATKFSETGYVGGDVDDLLRDLVREADGDIKAAQNGIVYIDEIDKIASNQHTIGNDISRTGVQRTLLKPMEETDVELKVPHDPISVMQEIERFRKTGERDKRSINTKNVLFIMSGAFNDLEELINKRLTKQSIGFGAQLKDARSKVGALQKVKSEDLVKFGFESEFIGRLPVTAIFEKLSEDDLYQILKNPNNPVVLSKKLDFAAYQIKIKIEDQVLRLLSQKAAEENTGARGLVSAIEDALMLFEKHLPSTQVKYFPITTEALADPQQTLDKLKNPHQEKEIKALFEQLSQAECSYVTDYINSNRKSLSERYGLPLTGARIKNIAAYYNRQIVDIGGAVGKIKTFCDQIKEIGFLFFKNQDINIVIENDAADFIIEQAILRSNFNPKKIHKHLENYFEYGFKLVYERTGRNRFFITKEAIIAPDEYINRLLNQPPFNPNSDN